MPSRLNMKKHILILICFFIIGCALPSETKSARGTRSKKSRSEMLNEIDKLNEAIIQRDEEIIRLNEVIGKKEARIKQLKEKLEMFGVFD